MRTKIPKLNEVERAAARVALARALEETDTRTEAAEALGIGRSTLYRMLDRHGMTPNLGLGGPASAEAEGLLSDVLKRESGE